MSIRPQKGWHFTNDQAREKLHAGRKEWNMPRWNENSFFILAYFFLKMKTHLIRVIGKKQKIYRLHSRK